MFSLPAMAVVAPDGTVAAQESEDDSDDYYTDFETLDVGDPAVGWELESEGEIVNESFYGERSLYVDDNGADGRNMFWADGPTLDSHDNHEIRGATRMHVQTTDYHNWFGLSGGDYQDNPNDPPHIHIRQYADSNEEGDGFVLRSGESDEVVGVDQLTNKTFDDQWIEFRMAFEGGKVRAKVWSAGESEPNDWMGEVEAVEMQSQFTIGTGMNNHGRYQYWDQIDMGSNSISGQLVNKETGEPISNGTVEGVGVNYDALNDSLADKRAKADELLDAAENPLPPEWESDRDLSGDWDDANGKYVGVYSSEDLATAPWVDEADLSPNLQVPEGEPVNFVVGDPSASAGLIGGSNEYNSQVPGTVTESGGETVTVEQLASGGDTIGTRQVELDQEAGGGYLDPSSLPYGEARLPPGIYRASVDGSGFELVFAVGDPDDLADMISQSLENEAGQLSEQANRVRENIEGGTFARVTTTTNENGKFSLRLPASVDRASVQAYRGDGQLLQDITGPSIDDLRTAASEQDYNGSFAVAPPERHTVPAENITVEAYSTDSLPHLGITEFSEWQDWLEGQFLDDDVQEMMTEYDERFEEMNRNNLETIYKNHRSLVESMPNAENRYLERSTFDSIQDAESLSGEELSNETRHMQVALANIGDVDLPDEGELDVEDELLNAEIPLPPGVDGDAVYPEIHWSNGTVEQVDEQYWSIESDGGILGGSALVIEDYPISESDPAAFDLRVHGASENGIVDDRVTGTNPEYEGTIPEISSIDLSSFAPGPSDRVGMTFRAGDDAPFDNLTGVEVYSPSGEELNVTTDDNRASFTTSGDGEHFVRATVTDNTGAEFVQSFRLKAEQQPQTRPPTVRAEEAVGGRAFAIVGEGLQNAQIRTNEQAGETTVVAEMPPDGEINELHTQVNNVMVGSDLNVQVVKGSDQQQYQNHVRLAIHESLGDNDVIWRDGEAITRDGDTVYGEVSQRNDGDKHIIRSYTGDDGATTVTIDRDAGFFTRARHGLSALTSGLPLVGMVSIPQAGAGALPLIGVAGIAARRRYGQ